MSAKDLLSYFRKNKPVADGGPVLSSLNYISRDVEEEWLDSNRLTTFNRLVTQLPVIEQALKEARPVPAEQFYPVVHENVFADICDAQQVQTFHKNGVRYFVLPYEIGFDITDEIQSLIPGTGPPNFKRHFANLEEDQQMALHYHRKNVESFEQFYIVKEMVLQVCMAGYREGAAHTRVKLGPIQNQGDSAYQSQLPVHDLK